MVEPRFLTIADVAELLATSQAQVRALIRRKELRAMPLGGRNQWRIQITDLEDYIDGQYRRAAETLRQAESLPDDEASRPE